MEPSVPVQTWNGDCFFVDNYALCLEGSGDWRYFSVHSEFLTVDGGALCSL